MAADRTDIDALLAAWRACGADRIDPVGFHRIAALRRRTAARSGAARQALETQLAAQVEAFGRQWEGRAVAGARAAAGMADAFVGDAEGTHAQARAPSALGALIEAMAADGDMASEDASRRLRRAAYPELPALEEVRRLWSDVRTRSQMRRSLAAPTEDAGPLNSSRLVHRALTRMRDVSPGYLRQFLAYADTLSWLETLQDAGVLASKAPIPTAAGKPRAKAKPRTRKGAGLQAPRP